MYDTLGRLYRQGLDVNANDALDLASNDRISESSVAINPYDGGTTWWAESRSYTYATAGSGAATLTGITWDRLNLDSGILADKWINDINGNRTHSYSTVNRAYKKLTTVTDTPESTIEAVQNTYNGLSVESTGTTGVNTKYGYDALGRLTQSIDPRTGTSSTTYLSGTSMVSTVTDAASIVQAVYSYDSAGRVKSVKNALNKYTYYDYTARNEKLREWGDTTYPVEYGFDALGRQAQMKTYAGSTTVDFTTATWPGSPGTASTTTWNFYATTGLLSSKTDAAGKSVSFTYTPARQVATRTLARGVVSTYAYSSTTAELTGTTYSDDTPAVSHTYNRLGQSATVADYTGTRTFSYNLGGTLELQNEQLGTTLYGDRRITRDYETAGVVGRYNRLSVGSSSSPYNSYSMAYGYDSSGRLNKAWEFPYTYVANSNLIASVSDTGSNWTQARTYLSNRDQLDIIETKWSTTPKAKFDYTQDTLGRSTAVARTGELFDRYGYGSQGLDVNYGYNDRSELTSEQTKLGGSATVLSGRSDSYVFDQLGNRTSATHNSNTASYTTNSLNQYTSRAVPGIFDVAGSASSGATVLTNGVTPIRQGGYFFQDFQINNSSARSITSVVGVTPQVKSLNGVYGFNWQNQPVSTPTVTGPTGQSVPVLEFGGSAWHVGMEKDPGSFPQGHGYTFQNGRTYTFSFWARTPSGSRSITAMMTEDGNSGIASATQTIDTNWKLIVVTKTFAAVGGSPRLFYNWDGGGIAFQVYGAQIADITDPLYAGVLPSYLAGTPEVMSYDDDGNLTGDGRWTYQYNAENQLKWIQASAAAVAAGDPNIAFHIFYDYLGRRVLKYNYQWNGSNWQHTGTQRRYVYDGWNLLFELDGGLNATALYVWGLDASGTLQGAGGVGGLLASLNCADGNWYSPAYDGNGNVMAMIKRSDGTIAAAYEYDASGKTIRESGPYAAANPFRYSTKYTDTETSLVYYGLRYYSPSLGRFINQDPIAEAGGINLYGFCGNSGVNRYDYLGLDYDLNMAPEQYRQGILQIISAAKVASNNRPDLVSRNYMPFQWMSDYPHGPASTGLYDRLANDYSNAGRHSTDAGLLDELIGGAQKEGSNSPTGNIYSTGSPDAIKLQPFKVRGDGSLEPITDSAAPDSTAHTSTFLERFRNDMPPPGAGMGVAYSQGMLTNPTPADIAIMRGDMIVGSVALATAGGILIADGLGLLAPTVPILKTAVDQLQSKFKHAVDFGITGNFNRANGAAFGEALTRFSTSPGVRVIEGTYRGSPVTFFLNPATGQNIITSRDGVFLSAWTLNAQQLQNVITRGKL